jgi:thiol-disulfide isomerase/thioredoxin/DNA-binding beta-propeller fold protein YncE
MKMIRLLATFIMMAATSVHAEETPMPSAELYRSITSHDAWLNTSRALIPDDLKGRVILLDFWTLGCANCMDIIPDLKYLEQTFGNKLAVIGVHSAKFANEKDTENIRNAVLRYELVHPVTNDADFAIWNKFGVRAWPTLVLINPLGTVSKVYEGEGHRAELETDIGGMLTKFSDRVTSTPLPIALESAKLPDGALRFPGKVIAAMWGNGDKTFPALYIADSGHNRIVVANPDRQGAIVQVIGNGKAGLKDGSFDQAEFFKPQGMAYKNGLLYVADLGNHALRLVDFKTETVTTLAGTGTQGYVLQGDHENEALKVGLSSPWDVAFWPDDNHLAIAMAGTHQLVGYDMAHGTVSLLAGNGHESIEDGTLPTQALSQPSGLFAAGDKLYFTDAESSSLRVLDKDGTVTTLIGKGLFDFGYKEGGREDALLQHCLGLTGDADNLYITDTYNHSVRRYDLKEHKLYNYAGQDLRGHADGEPLRATFNEPSGITFAGNTLYVADTNNHLIRTIDMKTGTVGTLPVQLKTAAMPELGSLPHNLPNTQKLVFSVTAGAPIEVTLALKEGWHINADAPSELGFYIEADTNMRKAVFDKDALVKRHITLPALTVGYKHDLIGTLYYCADASGSLCMIKSFEVKFEPKGTKTKITLPVN